MASINPADWGSRVRLTIPSGKASSDLAFFPVRLTKDNLPESWFDADGANPAKNGGGDLRFTLGHDGSDLLNLEIDAFITDNDPANGVAELQVTLPDVFTGEDSVFWGFANNPAADQPAADADGGSEGVWDANYVGRWSFKQDPSGGAPQLLDSTSNDNHMISFGTMLTEDLVDGTIGKGWDLDGGDDEARINDNATLDLANSLTMESVCTPQEEDVFTSIMGKVDSGGGNINYDLRQHDTDNTFRADIKTGATFLTAISTSNPAIGTPVYLAVTNSQGGSPFPNTLSIYVDGSFEHAPASVNGLLVTTNEPFFIGDRKSAGAENFLGVISESRLSNIARSADWIEATNETLMDPGNFVTTATPFAPGTDITKTIGPAQDFSTTNSWKTTYLDTASAFQADDEIGEINGSVDEGSTSTTFDVGVTSPTQRWILESSAAGRHEGKYDEAKDLVIHDNHLMFIQDAYVIVQDIQTKQTGDTDWGIVIQPIVESFVTVRSSLLGLNRPATIRALIAVDPNHADAVFDVYRNFAWWLIDIGGAARVFHADSALNNNTVWGNLDTCINGRSKIFEMHNNLIQNAGGGDGYLTVSNTNHSANLSNDPSSPDDAFDSKTVVFVNQAANDFHLDPSDTEARNNGVNLGSPYDIDIDLEAAEDPWSIGADQAEALASLFNKSLISGVMTQDAKTSELPNIMS